MKPKPKVLLIVLLGFFLSNTSFSQIKVSEFLQESKINTSNENALYLVDFWATWCGPCIHAKKYLGVLQKQFPNNFYIVSLSEENPLTVEKFLKKNPTDLAVAIDFYGETFKTFGVRVLPKAMLINANGKILWEGHPSDITKQDISRFLKQNKAKTSIDKVFKLEKVEDTVEEETSLEMKGGFALKLQANDEKIDFELNDKTDIIHLKGRLDKLLGYYYKVHSSQIKIPDSDNKYYDIHFEKDSKAHQNFGKLLAKKLKFKVRDNEETTNAYVLNINKPMFWDTNQINWGRNSPSYLISDSQIEADNVTLKDLVYTLSNSLDKPVVIDEQNFENDAKHDWQIHYKYFDLMKNQLKDNYGIDIEAKEVPLTVYKLIKKAP
ncbi:TlpA disulfide reductase family protein [Ichthyenterobacterium sp. W332]|uniref:TlpA disulfide reductase family protein n=1 Tax=Microcosmobacter mediterraneus TaxID=3075607 RepID=A0ABU2YPS1_9FLAO|nr:TlpA disulfide reductase family protein [Ichthyenterobacterium sp. W332]MDT0559255.1 TlpA disulfide reductase family protein [Ichthyenterobacterium sp. W332]